MLAVGSTREHSNPPRERTVISSISALDCEASEHAEWGAVEVIILAASTLAYPVITLFLAVCVQATRGVRRAV